MLYKKKKYKEAKEPLLKAIEDKEGQHSEILDHLGDVHMALGEKDEALQWLEVAYQQRAEWMVLLKVDPCLDGLRPDPRFQDLIRRMNFPP